MATLEAHDTGRAATRAGAEILVGFARTLAAAGVDVTPGRTAAFLTAAATLDASRRKGVYWAGRATLVSEPDDLAVYESAFAAYFSVSSKPLLRPRHRTLSVTVPLPDTSATAEGGDVAEEPDDQDTPVVRARASRREVLRDRDMAHLGAQERRELAAMIGLLRIGLPTRRARRKQPARLGSVDRRRALRAMLRAGGELRDIPRQRAGRRPRRVVLLIDVSGSMAPYADPLLRFGHVLVRHRPRSTDVFTMGTRLSRVTRALALRDPDQAMRAAAAVIPDFSGGTRLGEMLRAFSDRWGQRGTARGAVVVIFSDGWERGPSDLLAVEAARLHRLSHAVVWVNPHKGHEGYLPVQSGIVAALPHVDHFVAGHSLATLEELLEVIRDA